MHGGTVFLGRRFFHCFLGRAPKKVHRDSQIRRVRTINWNKEGGKRHERKQLNNGRKRVRLSGKTSCRPKYMYCRKKLCFVPNAEKKRNNLSVQKYKQTDIRFGLVTLALIGTVIYRAICLIVRSSPAPLPHRISGPRTNFIPTPVIIMFSNIKPYIKYVYYVNIYYIIYQTKYLTIL